MVLGGRGGGHRLSGLRSIGADRHRDVDRTSEPDRVEHVHDAGGGGANSQRGQHE